MMAKYSKAIAAFLTGLVGLLAVFGIDPDWITPELISGVTMLVSTVLVYAIPNRE